MPSEILNFMEHTKFCDIRTCNKVCGVDPTFTPDREKVKAYAEDYLTPANVGARKGIFVPRELVNKLSKLVALYDVEGLTIGAYVTNILVTHLVDNRDAINELSSEGEKTVSL